MLGKANTRKKEKFEYEVNVKSTSFSSTKNGIYTLQENAAALDTITPVVVTDGGGYI